MLTYDLPDRRGELSAALYRSIRDDILSGRLTAGDRLPSKRGLADHLQISKTTVENAYYQLATEGYIRPEARRGYFVERMELDPVLSRRAVLASAEILRGYDDVSRSETVSVDLTGGVEPGRFPFSVWAKLMRRELADNSREILEPVPFNGTFRLRKAVSEYLYRSRGIAASPDNIVIGAGTEYLYGMLIRLLGHDISCAVEEPGYQKIRQIYTANGAQCVDIPMDDSGLDVSVLRRSGAKTVHLSPSHNFPTGLVTPVRRRQELLEWAGEAEGRYIIEDDYDCEFRMAGRPLPAMQSIDGAGRVIYINTFTKTLAPSMRISYMVLPDELMERFRRELGFYSCAVCGFEQYTLAAFLSEGHFERHIARMKKHYRTLRDSFMDMLQPFTAAGLVSAADKDAGLHFIMALNTHRPYGEIADVFCRAGVDVRFLSHYYHGPAAPGSDHSLVINYSGLTESGIETVHRALTEIFG